MVFRQQWAREREIPSADRQYGVPEIATELLGPLVFRQRWAGEIPSAVVQNGVPEIATELLGHMQAELLGRVVMGPGKSPIKDAARYSLKFLAKL